MEKLITGCEAYQAIFFDFDGVIIDSVDVKTRAFATIFRPYGPEAEKEAVNYHLARGGLSRYKKFIHVFNNVLGREVSDKQLEELGRKFSDLALEEVLKASLMPGVLTTLDELRQKQIPAFVVSGTPEEEVKYIVKERDLSAYFREVRGSPLSKAEIVSDLLNRYNLRAQQSLFVGDAMSDYEAAKQCGLQFLGVVKAGQAIPFPGEVAVKKLEPGG